MNRHIYQIQSKTWDIPELRRLLEEIIPYDKEFLDFEVEHDFPGIGKKRLCLNACRIEKGEARPAMILLSFKVMEGNPG